MGLGAVNIDTAGIGNMFGSLGDMAVKIREAITGKKITDPAVLAEISAELTKLEFAAKNGQMEINKAEAASGKLFIAGWRPFIGWIGGASLIWIIFVNPIWIWLSELFKFPSPPGLAVGVIVPIIGGILGLGIGGRSYEKGKGVQDNH